MRPYRRITMKNVGVLVLLCASGLAFAAYLQQKDTKFHGAVQAPSGTMETPYVSSKAVMEEGELLQVQVPHDPLAIGITEIQTCWVWRDAKLSTASISCPAPPTLSASP